MINRFHRYLAQTKAIELTFNFIALNKCDLYNQHFSAVKRQEKNYRKNNNALINTIKTELIIFFSTV